MCREIGSAVTGGVDGSRRAGPRPAPRPPVSSARFSGGGAPGDRAARRREPCWRLGRPAVSHARCPSTISAKVRMVPSRLCPGRTNGTIDTWSTPSGFDLLEPLRALLPRARQREQVDEFVGHQVGVRGLGVHVLVVVVASRGCGRWPSPAPGPPWRATAGWPRATRVRAPGPAPRCVIGDRGRRPQHDVQVVQRAAALRGALLRWCASAASMKCGAVPTSTITPSAIRPDISQDLRCRRRDVDRDVHRAPQVVQVVLGAAGGFCDLLAAEQGAQIA